MAVPRSSRVRGIRSARAGDRLHMKWGGQCRFIEKVREKPCGYLQKSSPRSMSGRCKGPGAGGGLVCLRSRGQEEELKLEMKQGPGQT